MRSKPRFDPTSFNCPDPSRKIDAHTSCCKWLGERMDYNTAISASVVTPSRFEGMQFREAAAVVARTMAEQPITPS